MYIDYNKYIIMSSCIYGQYTVPSAEEIVNLGVGQPRNEILNKPLELMKKYMLECIKDDLPGEVLQYGDIPGYKRFRTELARYLSTKNYRLVEPDNLFQTNGATEAVTMLTKLLTTNDDLVLVENPTYFLMINIFKELGRDVKGVSMESDGVNFTDLINILRTTPKYRKVLFYCIPFNHNPTGITMSNEKCMMLCKLLEDYPNLYIMTDEVYQMLYYGDKIESPLAELHNRIITVGSFSKVIAPAFRIGWIYSKNESIIKMLKNSATRDSSGGNNVLNSLIVEKMLKNRDVDELLASEKHRLGSNLSFVTEYLKSNLGRYFNFVIPEGGYFVWMKLKSEYNCVKEKIFEKMEEYKVKFHCGNKFSINREFDDCIRISVSFYTKEEIYLGLERLNELMSNMGLIKTFEIDPVKEMYKKVGVFGHNGRLGKLIMKELEKSDKYEGKAIIKNLLDEANRDSPWSSELNSLNEYDIIVDVTSVDGTNDLLDKLIEDKYYPDLVIGTTGHKKYDKMRRYGENGKIFYMSNFSNGVNLVKTILKKLNTMNISEYDKSMIETHHIHKKDKPSGTAKTLGEYVSDIKIESIREGEVFGEHKIKLDNEYESIEIVHNAKKRELFSNGCVSFLDKLDNYKMGLNII